MNLQQWELFALAPDYVLVNYCRKNNEDLIRRLQRTGIRVGVLDTEGGVLSSFQSYEQTLATDPSVRKAITSFMTWGPRLGKHAVGSGWFSEDQVSVTGSPRFDFYNERWRPAAARLSEVPADVPRPLVMLNGNFPLVNPQFSTKAEEGRRLVQQYGYRAEEVAEWQTAQEAGMVGLTELANLLAGRFPAVSFVYRPHPFESLEPYAKLLAPSQNLRLIRRGTVDTWILQSVAVIQRSCSTAIEAAMAGTVALSPAWLPTAREIPAANSVSYSFATPEAMCAALEDILGGSFSQLSEVATALQKVVGDWFLSVDGASAHRVSERILEGLPREREKELDALAERALYGLDSGFRQRVAGSARKALRMSAARSFRPRGSGSSAWGKSEKYFGVPEVLRIANAIDEAAGEPSSEPLHVAEARSARGNDRYEIRSVEVSSKGS
jgi:surface carbohydrate biosynthesis protein